MRIVMEENSSQFKLKKLFKDKKHRRSEFIAAVIANLILLYIANNIISWKLSFIANSFADVLGIVNLFLIASLVVNFIFIFYYPHWFRNLMLIPIDILGLITFYTFLIVFPFVINNILLEYMLKFILVVFIIGSLISLVFHLIKFILRLMDR
jgi:hypothetical protein